MTASLGTDILPLVALSAPAIIFNKVDLPAPFLPIRAILSFSLMLKVTSLNKARPPNSTVTLSTEIIFRDWDLGVRGWKFTPRFSLKNQYSFYVEMKCKDKGENWRVIKKANFNEFRIEIGFL